jgi:hypothetical protein
MPEGTIALPTIKTLAYLQERLGGILHTRIWFHAAPGIATEADALDHGRHLRRD